jgi:hypothetical protein
VARKCGQLLLAIAALSASGCYTVRYYTDAQPGGSHHEEGADFFLWGLVGSKEVSLDAICPQGVSRWHNQATFLNGFLSFITLGIYVPRTIVVECSGGKAYRMTPEVKDRLFAKAGMSIDGGRR